MSALKEQIGIENTSQEQFQNMSSRCLIYMKYKIKFFLQFITNYIKAFSHKLKYEAFLRGEKICTRLAYTHKENRYK